MAAGTRQWREQVALPIRLERRPCWLHPYGMCKFNGEPIDYTAHHLAPRAYSCDHITPTSQGGQDVYSNGAASHRRCNCARHDDPVDTPDNARTDTW